MTRPTEAITGITLATSTFEETAHILSVFSKEHGRIKCVHKSFRKASVRGLSSLLAVEMTVCPSDKELWKCQDVTVVTSYPALRLKLDRLRHAAEVTDLIDKLLPLHLAVPHIYELYAAFMHHLPHFAAPDVAASLFLEKFYASEGMLEGQPRFLEKQFEECYSEKSDLGRYQKLIHSIRR